MQAEASSRLDTDLGFLRLVGSAEQEAAAPLLIQAPHGTSPAGQQGQLTAFATCQRGLTVARRLPARTVLARVGRSDWWSRTLEDDGTRRTHLGARSARTLGQHDHLAALLCHRCGQEKAAFLKGL